jgi:hypothetical protein
MELHELQDAFVECRVMRHRWDRIQDDGGVRRDYVESKTVARVCKRCERCGTIRYEAWSRLTGEILFVNYKYPQQYSVSGSHVKPWEVRMEYLDRLDPQPTRKRR